MALKEGGGNTVILGRGLGLSCAAVVAVAPTSHHPAARRRTRRRPQPAGSPQFSPVLAKAGSPRRQLCNFRSRQHAWRALAALRKRPGQLNKTGRVFGRGLIHNYGLLTTEAISHLYYKAFRSTTLLCNTRILAILFGKITYFFGGFGGSQKQYTHYNSSYHK